MKTFAVFCVVAAACGTSSKSSPDAMPAAAFVGTWVYGSGANLAGPCDDGTTYGSSLTGNTTLSKGVSADLANNDLVPGCTVLYDVKAKEATARPGQPCDTTDDQGNPLIVTVQSDTLALGSDSKSITENISVEIQFTGDNPATCTASATASLAKVSD